ncbi:MAG: nucleobase:cation symporter-2 family protein [Pseudomonadota bacterium]|nr:nucleobase:cation symporter-2 family protein [Pseudomonadota bacterium]
MALDIKTPRPATPLLYGLHDRPSRGASILAAIQHILASLVGIVTPTLIIGSTLGLGAYIPYLISMALFASGVCTWIQSQRVGPIGSGLLSVQGTSFSFLASILAAGMLAKGRGATPEEILALLFGVTFIGSFIEIILSQFIHKLKNIITPIVTGVVITVIGMSLVKVGFTDMAGGFGAANFGSIENLALAFVVIMVIVALSFVQQHTIRLSAVLIGLLVGFVVAIFTGHVDFSQMGGQPLLAIPEPFKFGFAFDWALFLPISLIYVITAIETTGDLTANSVISGEPIKGQVYMRRIKGGILGDGVGSAIAAMFNSFPNTTFSQNNGVIQLTGVASRHVGKYIAVFLVILGLFPVFGAVSTLIPKPVLGGATLILFGSIAVAGIRILATQTINRKAIYVMALSFGFGLGISLVPNAFQGLPPALTAIIGSPITLAGLTAIILTLVLPDDPIVEKPTDSVAIKLPLAEQH